MFFITFFNATLRVPCGDNLFCFEKKHFTFNIGLESDVIETIRFENVHD